MNDTQRVTVDFNRWLTQAVSGKQPATLNVGGSKRPSEVDFSDSSGGLANLPRLMGSAHTVPGLVRQAHAVTSEEFQRMEGRQLQYNFITVRVFSPDARLLDYDSLLGRLKSDQTVWFTHAGAVKFECAEDPRLSHKVLDTDGTVRDQPRVFSSCTASLFRRFKEGRLSIEQFNHSSVGNVTGYPKRCTSGTIKTSKYKLLSFFEPEHLYHMYQITPVKYHTNSKGTSPVCMQVIVRHLDYRTEEDLKEAGALVQGSDGQMHWTM